MKDAHSESTGASEIEQNIDIIWHNEKHTGHEVTNAYGDIEFHGAGKKTRAKVTQNLLIIV